MSLFAKSEYKEIRLPFILGEYTQYESEDEKCAIDIEAYGMIDGTMKYCYASYCLKDQEMYENGDYEELLQKIRESDERTVLVELKYKKGVLKDFKLKIDSLVKSYNDERFLKLELVAWGLNDKSCREG